MRFVLVLLMQVLTIGLLAQPTADQTERRRHFQVFGPGGAILYEGTEIVRSSEALHENTVLVSDAAHGHVVLRSFRTFKDQTLVYRVSDVRDRIFVQLSARFALSARTRSETLTEEQAAPNLTNVPTVVTLETNGGKWQSVETDFDDPIRLRAFRHEVRRSTDFWLLEAMERMKGTLFATEFGDIVLTIMARLVVYDSVCETSVAAVSAADAPPDCEFDKSFGFACSAKQLERVTKAAKEGKKLPIY